MSNYNPRVPRGGATQGDPRVDRILQAPKAFGDIVGQQVRNQAAAALAPLEDPLAGNGNGAQQIQKLVEQFPKLKQPKFSRVGDHEAATSWIKELEKAFALLKCNEEDKVTLAVYRLQGNAGTWWQATQEDDRVYTPAPDRMYVDHYEAKFSKPSMYAPRMVEDPVDRARRFRDGLKPELKDRLVPLNLKDYNELYKRA
ncbi:uncharacterized protein LOC115731004 [Rhodamnia argentea]|uniref:Uncharacterized protein LOC115731004 n=1 Tax=Rhodamnia argentea TaxID=178133 RepID=A0ABM3H4H8_9MYRT|nr:uncharacterized protein LOC115731004 [Rhodamnia argentea]